MDSSAPCAKETTLVESSENVKNKAKGLENRIRDYFSELVPEKSAQCAPIANPIILVSDNLISISETLSNIEMLLFKQLNRLK